MPFDLDQIKTSVPIEQIVNEDEPLQTKRGRYLRGANHDSLVVDTHTGMYHWNSQGEWGDVIEWLAKHRGMDFREAVEYLAHRGGLPAPEWGGQDAHVAAVARARADTLTVAAQYWQGRLWETPEALEYARSRGWTDETIRKAGLGYADGNRKGLAGELGMHGVDLQGDAAKAVLSTPKGMLVYPCVRGGRVVYYLCRSASTEDKKHWNPPVELVGERQYYANSEYSGLSELVVVVEGPACAITLAQWGISSIALAGTGVGGASLGALANALARHQKIALGLDAGYTDFGNLADALGPLVRIVTWPEKDANDWLQAGGTAEECAALLDEAPTWVEMVAAECGQVEGMDRPAAMDRAFGLIVRLDDFTRAMMREELTGALGINLRMFNALIKAKQGEHEEREEDAAPEIQYEIPGGYLQEHLLEMLVLPPEGRRNGHGPGMWRTKFAARFPDGQIRTVDYVDLQGEGGGRVRYRPICPSNRVLTERVVLFPSELPGEAVPLRDLIAWIRRIINKYVDVDQFYEVLASYYVLFSWLYDAFNTVPYLRMLGDAGTGKSRFIQVVGAMCYRPIYVTGAATTSPIFRMLDRYRGTLVLDEADFRVSDEAADVIKILNTGYQRTQGVVLRSGDKNSGFDTEVFVCYGPKVIATRKPFRDWALESRCLTHQAGGPTTRTDIPIDLPLSFWTEEILPVRNALLRHRLEHWRPEIELNYEGMDLSVEQRLNQVTIALMTLIDDPELKEDLRAFIREYNRQLIAERGTTLTARVLEALVGVYWMDIENKQLPPDLRVSRVTKATNVLIDYENEDGAASDDEDEAGMKVKPKKVGSILRTQLHFGTERKTDAGRAYVVLWDQERAAALRRRFGIDTKGLDHIIKVLRDGMGEQQALPLEL